MKFALSLVVPEQRPELPPWESDALSQFFESAQFNEHACALSVPPIFGLLRRVDAAFARANEALENVRGANLLIPQWLVVRVRSSLLAASRLTMSGQISEAFPVLRAAIEQTWYAVHIATDPKLPSRAEIWLRRNDNEEATEKAKREFTVGRVRRSHESIDGETAKQLHWLYKQMIEFGGHPNQLGMFSTMGLEEDEDRVTFQVGILYPRPLPVVMTLRMVVAVAVGALKAFAKIFPERFELVGLCETIEQLVVALNSTFKPYVSKRD